MASRLKLHEELCELIGSRNVYYNPPVSVKLNYPCIKYSLSGMDHKRSNNKIYNSTNQYEIITIDYDTDSNIHEKIINHFQMCSFNREYIADNLSHVVLKLYY